MVEKLWDGKIRPGFEMLVNNFSAGFVGFFTGLAAYFWLAPLVKGLTDVLGKAVGWLVDTGLIPLASVIVEPAKVLFLNNAINHGVFTPIGGEQSTEIGHSLLYLVEANPGPGAGLLLALTVFGVGAARATAPGAFIIQFLGGIHEIYFPYVLMKPKMIAATILGAASGILTFIVTGAGLVASPSPGSIFAYFALTPRGGILPMLAGVAVATAVTFAVAAVLLGFGRGEKPEPTPEESGTPARAEADDTATATAGAGSPARVSAQADRPTARPDTAGGLA
jgi:PTS system mannitol-specific IIC component